MIDLDPMQENRRLRAAMEQMRSKQALARGGFVAGVMLVLGAKQYAPLFSAHPLNYVVGAAGLAALVTAATAIPFVRSPCPKCKQPYHSISSLLRRADEPRPCKSCGFQINTHVSRYS